MFALALAFPWVLATGFETIASAASDRAVGEVLHVGAGACFDHESLTRAVSFWLKRDAITEPVEFEVRGVGGDVVFLTKRSGAAAGERHLHTAGGSCGDVTNAVALAIALTIDATILDRIGIEPPPPKPSAPAPSPSLKPAPTPSIAPPLEAPRARFEVELELTSGLLAGALSRPVAQAGIAVGLTLDRRYSLRLSGQYAGNSTSALGAGRIDESLIASRLETCISSSTEVRIRGCAGLAVGALHVDGSGYLTSYSPTLAWVAGTLHVDARLPVTRQLGLWVGAELLIDAVRPELEVLSTDGSVADSRRSAAASGAAAVGIAWVF